jgi:hypothetical protein
MRRPGLVPAQLVGPSQDPKDGGIVGDLVVHWTGPLRPRKAEFQQIFQQH